MLLLASCLALAGADPASVPQRAGALALSVDPVHGQDEWPGTFEKPLRSISAAIARIPEPLAGRVTITLQPGRYETTGGVGMPADSLVLCKRMQPGAEVEIHPLCAESHPPARAVFAWKGERRMVIATEGAWRLSQIQVGTFEELQIRGITALGPARVALADARFELRSNSDGALVARRGGRIELNGPIRVNDRELGERPGRNTHSGLIATDHGVIEFDQREGSSLVLGDGSLVASYWGSIRLGCDSAVIRGYGRSNLLSIGNSGRIDLRNTRTTLRAIDPKNTPIGLEDDGHVLAEDAVIEIEGRNDSAIALQKGSALWCNDIWLKGEFETAIWASSGSRFCGRFKTDVRRIEARTGAVIAIEKVEGRVLGPVDAKSGGVVSLPDRVESSR